VPSGGALTVTTVVNAHSLPLALLDPHVTASSHLSNRCLKVYWAGTIARLATDSWTLDPCRKDQENGLGNYSLADPQSASSSEVATVWPRTLTKLHNYPSAKLPTASRIFEGPRRWTCETFWRPQRCVMTEPFCQPGFVEATT